MLDFEDAVSLLSVWRMYAEYRGPIRLKRRIIHYLGQARTTLFVRDRRISKLYNPIYTKVFIGNILQINIILGIISELNEYPTYASPA